MAAPTATKLEPWQAQAKAKRDSIMNLIPPQWRLTSEIPSAENKRSVSGEYLWQYLSKREIEITEAPAVDIVAKTTTGEWKAKEVILAFCHRASLAHQLVNCLHEIFYEQAIEDAEVLDRYYAEHGRPIGPLHGLPVSLKDQFHVKGVETTMGYVGWIGTFQGQKTSLEDKPESEMVRELRALGAVLYCKTAVPHTLMSGETHNAIIDYTWNPHNRHLSAGGSSGGEAALIAMKGSPIGFGTDYSGSIRMPSAFCGLYSMRPSPGRLPYEGMANSMDGQNTIPSVVGPISHSAPSLRLLTKALLSQTPWVHDPLVLPLPWRAAAEHHAQRLVHAARARSPAGKLAFGILRHDAVVTPHPPVRRAMDLVARSLARLGHTLIEWTPPAHARANAIALTTWMYDGGADVHAALALSGEPPSVQVARIYGAGPVAQMGARAVAANCVAKRRFQKEYLEYWNGTVGRTGTGRVVDGLVMPVAPFAAPRRGMFYYAGYTVVGSVLEYTAVTVPVTVVDKRVDVVDVGYAPLSEVDAATWMSYDPEIYDGAHVAVQLVGRRLQEEKMLVLAEYVGEAVANEARVSVYEKQRL